LGLTGDRIESALHDGVHFVAEEEKLFKASDDHVNAVLEVGLEPWLGGGGLGLTTLRIPMKVTTCSD